MNRSSGLTRRAVGAGLTGIAALSAWSQACARETLNIVIIGGGFGGATAARYLRALLPQAQLHLIEPQAVYTACPFSNLVLTGERSLSMQTFSYQSLQARGIVWVRDTALDVDAATRTVRLASGQTLSYDRLILSPGVDMRWGAVEGYDEAAAQRLPHAWKAGIQTRLLRDQLAALPEGGRVILSVPPAPYRCPPGPYERASLIAHYLKHHKRNAHLLILDSKDTFSKKALFQQAWSEAYPDQLDWRGASDDGTLLRVEAETRTVWTDFERHTADIINIIPPQKAGWIADRAGVSDQTGWCPVDPVSFASTQVPYIHVLGDACLAAPVPKSAFSANLQAKICAISIAREIAGLAAEPTLLANTCYSYTRPDEAISITGVYRNDEGRLRSVAKAGGLSPLSAGPADRRHEALQAEAWFRTITAEAFG